MRGPALLPRLLAPLAAAALLAAPAAGAARPRPVVDRGIVQAATASALTLRELDGSIVSVPIDSTTAIIVDGRPAQPQDVQPGMVAAAVIPAPGAAARVVRAVGRTRPTLRTGTIAAVSGAGLVLATAQGQVTATVGPATQVRLDGRPASEADLRPGMRAAVLQLPDGEARAIRAFAPRAAPRAARAPAAPGRPRRR